MLRVRDSGGTLRTITGIQTRDASAVLRQITEASVVDASSTLQPVFGVIEVTADPTDVYGYGQSGGSIVISTQVATAYATGGVPPYTYLWEPDDVSWEAVTPTAQGSSFRSPPVAPLDFANTTFTCTVTDANGATGVSNTVNANAYNIGF